MKSGRPNRPRDGLPMPPRSWFSPKTNYLQVQANLERLIDPWEQAQTDVQSIRGSWRWRADHPLVSLAARILRRHSEPLALDRLEQLF
jgi:hypothetical protein